MSQVGTSTTTSTIPTGGGGGGVPTVMNVQTRVMTQASKLVRARLDLCNHLPKEEIRKRSLNSVL